MKKFIAILLGLLMVLALVACSGNGGGQQGGGESQGGGEGQETTPAEGGGEEQGGGEQGGAVVDVKLASHNAVVEGNPYRVRYEKDIQEAAADAINYGYNVSYSSFVSNQDASTEQQQLQNSINEGYNIIMNNPVATTGLDPIILQAQEAGIIYINADCAYMSTDVNILNVVTDQEYLGYKTGTYAGEVLGSGAKVAMIAAWEGNQANTDRQRGFEKAIEEQGLVVVATGNHDWDPTKAQQIMAEILNQGTEMDGVLISQCAENALAAYDAAGVAYPGFIGFGDTGAYMQKMLEINKDEIVTPYIVLSNPPGVGATALNFALNELAGNTLKDGVFQPGYEDTHQIWIKSRVCYTDKDQVAGTQVEGKSIEEYANSFEAGDSITFWLTFQEVKDTYFN
ncbi:MAG: substrate-binding domain-containing protein [Lachnospiraceae bacterium]|nr:substrate-binding domain-containing protein [Lachnospiraceae bacterium]